MASLHKSVTSTDELLAATQDPAVHRIIVRGVLSNLPSIRLGPGQALAGESEQGTLSFAAGSDGLQLSSDNAVANLRLEASLDKRAIFNDTGVDSGESLVKGVVVQLSAIALSIKAGGSVREIEIDGGVVTHGKDIAPLELHGAIGALRITGGIQAAEHATPH